MKITVAGDLIQYLAELGADAAFGVSGGFIVPVWHELVASERIKTYHCRHESGAVCAASEYSLCKNRPAIAFTTAGPGISNALTGLKSASLDGSRLIFISAITASASDGRWPLQETTPEDLARLAAPQGQGYFHAMFTISSAQEYLAIRPRIAGYLASVTGCTLGLFLTPAAQNETFEQVHQPRSMRSGRYPATITPVDSQRVQQLAGVLHRQNCLLWLGFGARHAAENLAHIAELSRSTVITTPRGKGIFPEAHPLCAGTTGLGSDSARVSALLSPEVHPVVMILGSRLGELSSSYAQQQLDSAEVYFIGLNVQQVRASLPAHITFIEADIPAFVAALYRQLVATVAVNRLPRVWPALPFEPAPTADAGDAPLHPLTVMSVLQDIVIDRYNGYLAAEAGNAFVWTNRYLKFSSALRYRTSPGFGAMAHYACGLIGIAAAAGETVVAVTGDGSMLMANEVSTAVRYRLPAVWLVLNDGCYNMCRQGVELLGNAPLDCEIPPVDFALLAQSLGATGYRVKDRAGLEQALTTAMRLRQPAIIDVAIDRNAVPPLGDRIQTLKTLSDA